MIKKAIFFLLLPFVVLLYAWVYITYGPDKDEWGWYQKVWDTKWWFLGVISYPFVIIPVWVMGKVYPLWEELLD